MKLSKALLFGCMALACHPAIAESRPDFAPLARLVEETKRVTGQPSGTAVAVVKDGKVIYQGYFGYADIGKKLPVIPSRARSSGACCAVKKMA